jgi:glycosyltransferase involved in cell wall biosynthesis
LAKDYIKDGWNGLIINKTKEDLLNALHKIYTDDKLYNTLSNNARKDYLDNYTLLQYGKNIGKEIEKLD